MRRSESGGEVELLEWTGEAFPLAVGGLPSPESIFTIHCVAEIVRRTRAAPKVIPFNVGADAAHLAEAAPDAPTLLFFDTPDRDARAALMKAGVPIVLVMGDFAETAQFCMIARDLEPLQAARFVSESFSCLEPLQRLNHARAITLNKAADFADWIDEVALWLGLQPPRWAAARQQMLAEYAAWPTVETAIHALVEFSRAVVPAWKQLPEAVKTLFQVLGTSYHSGSIDALFWPADCILEPGEPVSAVDAAISLTGPARVLTFGPVLHVPPGRWTARYQFEIDEHRAGNVLEFDVLHDGAVLVSRRASVAEAGRFGLDCEFEIEDARLFVENRAILAEGSIGGVFKPIGIRLNRVG